MQAPTTMTREHSFNRITAGAIGLALVAASIVGAATLGNQVELSLPLGNEQAQQASTADPLTAMLLLEQNVWEHQPAVNFATSERIQFIEDNTFDYASPVTASQIQFQEENIWEYSHSARLASAAPAVEPLSQVRLQFVEENIWEYNGSMIPPIDKGATDY